MRCNLGKMLTPAQQKVASPISSISSSPCGSPQPPSFTDPLENASLTVKVREVKVCKNYGGVPLCTFPALTYLFKVDFGNTRTMCEIC